MRSAILDAEHEAFRARVRTFLAERILPRAAGWEEAGRMPADGWRAFGAEGLLALGHRGEGLLRGAVFLEELGGLGFAGLRSAIGVHAYMAASYLELFGTDRQRAAHLPAIRRGDRIAALAISEDGAGSDLRNLRTCATARPDGDFVVNGEKAYVANGSAADLVVALVRTGDSAHGLGGMSLLLVDATAPGLTRHPRPMLGWRGADTCRLTFEDVTVARDRLIGREDRALLHLGRALDFERLIAGVLAVGGARHSLDLAHRFVRDHRVRDAPLSANQAVRHRLGELIAEFELVRHYAYHAAWLASTGALDTGTAATLKLRATELVADAARTGLQYQGARGQLDDSVAARLYRDAAAGTVAAGASELMLDMIFAEAAAGVSAR